MRQQWTAVAMGILVGAMGCAADSDDPATDDGADAVDSADAADAGDAADGTDGTDGSDGADGGPVCDDTSAEDWALVFGQRYRLPGETDFDLYMMRPQRGYPPVKLTEFSLKDEGTTCQLGCEIDEGLDWIAVTTEQAAGSGGYTMQFGRFDGCLNVVLNKGNKFEGISHLEFAGDFLYYSEKLPGCTGQSCQYQVTRVDLNKPTDKRIIIPAFPKDDDKDWIGGDTVYGGFFRVSPDGEAVVLLSPTIRSQRVYLWTAGTLHEVDYLCDNLQNETCIGAGSRYDDEDPVAISPDSKSVVLFTVHKSALRVRQYSTENPLEIKTSSILNVAQATDEYEQVACAVREPWQPVKVIGRPSFTPDGKHLLFIGWDDCGGGQKANTNIFRIDPSWIGDLTPVEESELENVTKNPEGDIAENKEMTGFSLSPDGKRIFFAATPELGQNYQPFKGANEQRIFGDTEIYKMSICGGPAEQITNDVAYEASRPQALALPDPTGCGTYPLPELE